jgi:hypothetical protein
VAYNSHDNEYLVVWSAGYPYNDSRAQIYGQRISAATGALLGVKQFQISEPRAEEIDGGSDVKGHPSVAYNSAANQYMVAWGEITSLNTGLWGQLLAADGTDIGGNRELWENGFIILNDVGHTDIAYNSNRNEYMVVWEASLYKPDPDPSLPFYEENEILSQRLNAQGADIGNSGNVTAIGRPQDGEVSFPASPAIAFNPTNGRYLVAWSADRQGDGKKEIFTQMLGAYGGKLLAGSQRISDSGPRLSFDETGGYTPAVAYNSHKNEFLVVWSGHRKDFGSYEQDIVGQRISAAGNQIGEDDLRISHMGPDGYSGYRAGDPAVAYNAQRNQYVVIWVGEEQDQDFLEVHGQLLTNGAVAVGPTAFQLSNMGPEGSADFPVWGPAIACNSAGANVALWCGLDNRGGLLPDKSEVFLQRFTFVPVAASQPAAGGETGTTAESQSNSTVSRHGSLKPQIVDEVMQAAAEPWRKRTLQFDLVGANSADL